MAATYGKLEAKGMRWIISAMPPHVAIKLKSLFLSIPKTQVGTFSLPMQPETSADLVWFTDRYPLEIAAGDARKLKKLKKQFLDDRAALDAILLPGWKPNALSGFRPGYALEHGQSQAFELTQRMKRLLLGDDVGLGKTWVAMACAIAQVQRGGKTAIVVEPHLASQWQDEFIVPYSTLTCHIIDGTTPYDLPDADIYIFRYSNIFGWVDIAGTGLFKTLVFDEIQQLRTGTESSKGHAALVFANHAEIKIGLSATPVFNYGSEIWNILRYIDGGILGSFEEFTREWCHVGQSDKWLVTDPDALGSYLLEAMVFMRRVRQGRPINRLMIEVGYDQEEADKADALARVLALQVMRGSFEERGQAARELDALARHTTGVAKARSVAAYAKILLSEGVPIIVGGWHRDVYDIWLKELAEFKPMLYTGSESPKQKDAVKKAFIRGDTNCVLISLRSGAGLDGLQTRCSTVLVGELDWSPQVYEQLFGRVDRRGQLQDEITAIFLHCRYGSDPTIMTVNAIKRDQARGITDPGIGQQPVYSDVSHIKMLAQRYLERTAA